MSIEALSDPVSRKSASRSAPSSGRRGRKRIAAPPSRNTLAGDFLAICQLDPAVDAIRSPAPVAVFPGTDQQIDHVADFEILRDGVAVLVDIATDADLAHHPLLGMLVDGAVESVDGRRLIVETAASLRAEPRLSTVKLVMACRHTPVSAGDRVRILHHLDECGTAPLVECAGMVQNTMDGVAAVLALAVEGLVAIEIDRPILPEMPVRRRKLPSF